MATTKFPPPTALASDVLEAFENLEGYHEGFRPAHANGILLAGVFKPSDGGRSLTRAPHLQRESTPVSVRLSTFAGVPRVPDNDPNSSPRGIAIRFHLADHVHTDIIGHSTEGFPSRTAEDFVEFLNALAASPPTAPHPTAIESYLGSHPAALRFVQTPKPFPTSFATESFFSVNAYQFTNSDGGSRFGRYRIRPEGNGEYLSDSDAGGKPPTYLFDELKKRIANGPVRYRIFVQLAEPGDVVDDATVQWPETRSEVDFGAVELTAVTPNNDAEQRHIIFDPIPRVDGIDPSADPLLQQRSEIYLASGRRHRHGPAD